MLKAHGVKTWDCGKKMEEFNRRMHLFPPAGISISRRTQAQCMKLGGIRPPDVKTLIGVPDTAMVYPRHTKFRFIEANRIGRTSAIAASLKLLVPKFRKFCRLAKAAPSRRGLSARVGTVPRRPALTLFPVPDLLRAIPRHGTARSRSETRACEHDIILDQNIRPTVGNIPSGCFSARS